MSLEPKNLLDALAYKLLRHREEAAPADLFDRAIAELDRDKRRRFLYWWSTGLGVLVVAGAASLYLYTSSESASTAGISPDSQSVSASVAAAHLPAFSSTPIAVATGVEFSAADLSPNTAAAFAKTTPDGERLVPAPGAADNPSSRLDQNAARAITPLTNIDHQAKNQQAVEVAPPSDIQAFSAPLAPKEFNGYTTATATQTRVTPAPASSQLSLVEGAREVGQQLSAMQRLPARDYSLEAWPSRRLKGINCPSLALGPDKKMRMTVYGGPRFDQKVYGTPSANLEDYKQDRIAAEAVNNGLNIGARLEVGRLSGPFAGFGIEFGQYNGNINTYGEVRGWLTSIEFFEGPNGQTTPDTIRTPIRDTFTIKNRHQTMAFTGTAGYRQQLGRLAVYVAADLNYEIMTESTGLILNPAREEISYRLGDRWVNRTPGISVGGRFGLDFDVVPSPNGDTGPLGFTLEVNARNTGMFSGDWDPLEYRYSRVGLSAGLRYQF